ncbi:MAG: hypothetical protein R6V06_00040, partial [Kiritimatiellia bacterium]
NHFFKTYTVGLGDPDVPSGSYIVSSRGSGSSSSGETLYSLSLKAADDASGLSKLRLLTAENESILGRTTDAAGIMFGAAEAEELYVLLSYGAMVTIVP